MGPTHRKDEKHDDAGEREVCTLGINTTILGTMTEFMF